MELSGGGTVKAEPWVGLMVCCVLPPDSAGLSGGVCGGGTTEVWVYHSRGRHLPLSGEGWGW